MSIIIRHDWGFTVTRKGKEIAYGPEYFAGGEAGGYHWVLNAARAVEFDTLEEAKTTGDKFLPYHVTYIDSGTKEVIQVGNGEEIYSEAESEGGGIITAET